MTTLHLGTIYVSLSYVMEIGCSRFNEDTEVFDSMPNKVCVCVITCQYLLSNFH